MLTYETRDRVAVVRPDAIPAPGDWLASLDPILDDTGVWCLLVDASRMTAVDSRWDGDTAATARLWRKPVVCSVDGAYHGPARAFIDAADFAVASPGSTLDGIDAPAARAAGELFSVEADPVAAALRLAKVIASRAPYATQLAKEAIWRGRQMPLSRALRFETDLTLLLQTTKDRAEGVAAFIEKRQPHFTGS